MALKNNILTEKGQNKIPLTQFYHEPLFKISFELYLYYIFKAILYLFAFYVICTLSNLL